MKKESCKWIYRDGTHDSHWAVTTCKRGYNPLTKIKKCSPYIGVADFYNGKECPICRKPIEMDYAILQDKK